MLEQIAGLGFIVKIVNIDTHLSNCVDLRELLKEDGMFLLDGTLNQVWFDGEEERITGETRVTTDGVVVPAEVGPAELPRAWRHSVAIKNGFILEYTMDGIEKHNVKLLWIGSDGVTADLNKGYFREILKVYRVF